MWLYGIRVFCKKKLKVGKYFEYTQAPVLQKLQSCRSATIERRRLRIMAMPGGPMCPSISRVYIPHLISLLQSSSVFKLTHQSDHSQNMHNEVHLVPSSIANILHQPHLRVSSSFYAHDLRADRIVSSPMHIMTFFALLSSCFAHLVHPRVRRVSGTPQHSPTKPSTYCDEYEYRGEYKQRIAMASTYPALHGERGSSGYYVSRYAHAGFSGGGGS
ncbi:hypothetical protein BKA63DRAFT_30935 [Paraphoma chrysanthemicola]|nr:hypothetical protein BKA63DRAFT_30935 [Paraphoma chrysanthemicola]